MTTRKRRKRRRQRRRRRRKSSVFCSSSPSPKRHIEATCVGCCCGHNRVLGVTYPGFKGPLLSISVARRQMTWIENLGDLPISWPQCGGGSASSENCFISAPPWPPFDMGVRAEAAAAVVLGDSWERLTFRGQIGDAAADAFVAAAPAAAAPDNPSTTKMLIRTRRFARTTEPNKTNDKTNSHSWIA